MKRIANPFQKYGMLDGVVRHIGADALEKPASGNAAVKSMEVAAYRTLINLGSSYLESQGRQHRLAPGMQVSAEVNLGSRTVLEYLLSPIQKTVSEAARER